MSAREGESEGVSGRPAEPLDDEAPPEIPDISSEDANLIPPLSSEVIEMEPDSVPTPSEPGLTLKRLSPPPKPRRRERSITAPQTPSSRSYPPALAGDAVARALKAPPIPSLVVPPLRGSEPAPGTNDELRGPSSVPPVVPPHSPLPERPSAPPEKGAAGSVRPSAAPADGPVTAMRIINVGDGSVPVPPSAPVVFPGDPATADAEAIPATLRAPISQAPGADAAAAAESEGESGVQRSASSLPPAVAPAAASPPPLPVAAQSPAAPPVNVDAAEELADDDVAPASEDKPSGPLRPPSALAAPPSAAAPVAPPSVARLERGDAPAPSKVAPPPPPRRAMASNPGEGTPSQRPKEPPRAAKLRDDPAAVARDLRNRQRAFEETARTKAVKRPWWEDLFGEDFVRAMNRLSDEEVRREVDFIEESLGVANGGVVLDLGCGAGYHAVELASRGYGVVGYDLSLFQLALAADVAQERGQRLNLLQGDMREMAFDEMFDGIYCWNTTFGYFEEDKNLAVAQRIYKALRPGGMFLLDVINRDFAVGNQPSQVWYEGDSCVCMDDMNVDFITSRMRVKRSIILDDGRTREVGYSVRLYALHELGKVLHDVGFRITEASGHPSTPGVFFGPPSPRIIILAQRP